MYKAANLRISGENLVYYALFPISSICLSSSLLSCSPFLRIQLTHHYCPPLASKLENASVHTQYREPSRGDSTCRSSMRKSLAQTYNIILKDHHGRRFPIISSLPWVPSHPPSYMSYHPSSFALYLPIGSLSPLRSYIRCGSLG